ncbi:hypothetical protein IQ07DRAFT_573211 [Pyrenochaeta sp. DS3sAY3a]|nr:hypothetical protein IQ07DRAFT_573211 [Pyrenochaeta sp. DS3sAY3a]
MSVRRALAPRSVHLRIVPRPANLSESREIFRLLQRFGELSTYKYLRYEYQNPADNVALAIFRDEHAAQQALQASPIRFALEKVTPSASEPAQAFQDEDAEDDLSSTPATPSTPGIDDMLRPSQLLNRAHTPTASPKPTPAPPPPMPFDAPHPPPSSPPTHTTTKWFQVTLDRSRAVHQDFIERQPYWKQFQPMHSMAQADLAKQVPHIGLSDVSKRPPNAHRTPNRVLRVMSEYVERRMPTIRGMVEDGEGEVAFRKRRGI